MTSPSSFFPSLQCCALILSYKCFKMFLNSVVSLTEITSYPLKLFWMIKLFLYPAEPSPPLVLRFLAAWVCRMLVFPFVGGKMKRTLWPKAITQILAWKSPLEVGNASFSQVHLAALSCCLCCASPPERLLFKLPSPRSNGDPCKCPWNFLTVVEKSYSMIFPWYLPTFPNLRPDLCVVHRLILHQ